MPHPLVLRRLGLLAGLGALALLAGCAPGPSRCAAPPGGWVDLPAAALPPAHAPGRSLRVVALGSSSTQGVGASDADSTYPAQLARILHERHPGLEIEVINRGVGGDVVADNLKRLDHDVLALLPDLVIWQVGTNDALRGTTVDEVLLQVREGIARMRAQGGRVALLASQPLPDERRDAPIRAMNRALREVAAATGTPYLDRYRLMAYWRESGAFDADELLAPDRLHMTDVTYRCLALRVGDAVPLLAGLDRAPASGLPPPAALSAR